MPEVDVNIGGRTFAVACQEGEEEFLLSAAAMLDTEASVLVDQMGRVPEARMLLMAGLMLADKTAGLEDRAKAAEAREAALLDEIARLQNAPAPEAPEPERIEVPVLPAGVADTMAELAARAEALAEEIEEKAGK
ncbi:cell division protein ZapA [Roseivivax marinus]|jgi:cell division protein ZapA|uniref:Cell division protein ZapA n=1 Tax=Roseivivax marinus TaxID=1379903 RepID=W4HPG2_9RHOB|nr:cell division protein ZapA [Roseivivax marinus]ETW14318.1 cell division protein ZapA [Roseivivax marinus]